MTPEDELLEEIRRDHPNASAEIQVQPSSAAYFEALQRRFPVYGSKIDWDCVPKVRIRRIETADSEEYFERAESFANEVWTAERFDREWSIVVIGDSAMNVALNMPIRVLETCLRSILRMPQHSYVLAQDASWCMAFTMEGDVCFGYAPA